MLATTLDLAIAKFLESNKSPSRKVHEIDNRGSHFYLAKYWAEALAGQEEDAQLRERFARLHQRLDENEAGINEQLLAAQGDAVDVGGYYAPNSELASVAMRPSTLFNEALASL